MEGNPTTATTATQAPASAQGVQTGEQNAQKVTFSPEQQEYVNKIVARELKRMQDKTDKKILEIQEAEKLKNMSEEERRQAEIEGYKKKIADYEKQGLVNQFKTELATKGLPSEYADFIPVADAEQASKAVKFLEDYSAKIKAP